MALLFLLFAILGSVPARPSNEIKPVEITVFYEALCPACQYFIPNQLLPTYSDEKYRSLISKLTLVPYGWADVKNASTHEYQCQHGPAECQGNRLHACAIKYIADQVITLNYISCLDNQTSDLLLGSSEYPIDACQDVLPAGAYTKIINCYNSDEGWKLFQKYGEKTTAFFKTHAFVPYVSFNYKHDNDLALSAIRNFKPILCQVTGAVGADCNSSKTKKL